MNPIHHRIPWFIWFLWPSIIRVLIGFPPKGRCAHWIKIISGGTFLFPRVIFSIFRIIVIMDYNERVRRNEPKDRLFNFPYNFLCDFPMYVSRHNVWIARLLSSGGRARFYFHFYHLQPLIIQFKTTIQSGETCRSSRGLGETFKSLCIGRSFQWMTTSFLTNS